MEPAEWKAFYARERAALDLDALLDAAPELEFPTAGALVFPHTRLTASGTLVAAVAKAVARTGQDVLAIGVLHGGTRAEELRGVHDERGLAADEFSLDGFRALLARTGTTARVHARFPFLVGDRPDDLPGLGELRRLASDSVVVATTDPIHHGVGYATAEARDETLPETQAFARARVEEQLDALARADFGEFADLCARDRSDFRDAGPVLATLVPNAEWAIEALQLVDYSDVFECARPTWVAAARIRVTPRA
jgi:predicted class III extradiol MEMO1 family dioxygenase